MQKMLNRFEAWFEEQSTQRKLLFLGFGAVFILVFALNYLYPMNADDYLYSIVKYNESFSFVDSLSGIAKFLHFYFFNWGGRLVAHLIAHVLLLFNPIMQDVLNTLSYCVLLYFIYKISSPEKYNAVLFAFIGVSVFYFAPSFLSSAVWITGSANYLWTTVIVLAFIYPFYRFANNFTTYKESILRTVLFFLFGVVAGCTNESLGPILFLIIGAYVFYIAKRSKIPHWMLAGLVGIIIGCCALILAPGNSVRAMSEGHPSLFNSLGDMQYRLPNLKGAYLYFMSRLIVVYVICLLGYYFFAKNEELRKRTLYNSLLFFIAANISIWLILLSPTFPPRAFFSITVLTIVSIAILYANIDFRKNLPKIVNVLFLLGVIFFATVDYAKYFRGLQFLHGVTKANDKIIEERITAGDTVIELEEVKMDYRFEFTNFSDYYRVYYGVDFRFLPSEEMNESKSGNAK